MSNKCGGGGGRKIVKKRLCVGVYVFCVGLYLMIDINLICDTGTEC